MTQTQDKGAPGADAKAKEMTAADAAKRVRRPVYGPVKTGTKDGVDQIETRLIRTVPVLAKEVLDFKDYGGRVVVVTVDGQKFDSDEKYDGVVEKAAE